MKKQLSKNLTVTPNGKTINYLITYQTQKMNVKVRKQLGIEAVNKLRNLFSNKDIIIDVKAKLFK